jgi:hypothetical protein
MVFCLLVPGVACSWRLPQHQPRASLARADHAPSLSSPATIFLRSSDVCAPCVFSPLVRSLLGSALPIPRPCLRWSLLMASASPWPRASLAPAAYPYARPWRLPELAPNHSRALAKSLRAVVLQLGYSAPISLAARPAFSRAQLAPTPSSVLPSTQPSSNSVRALCFLRAGRSSEFLYASSSHGQWCSSPSSRV